MDWTEEEMRGIDLGDARLERRSAVLLRQMLESPGASIPEACRGWAETKAAYRFFENAETNAERILSPHRSASIERIRGQPVVLCVNDTTEVDFTSKRSTRGLGPLSFAEQHGFYLHPLLAVTPERVCLGVLSAQWLVRDLDTHGQSVATKKKRPIAEKESRRWPEAFADVCALAETVPETRLVYVADRESDIYELLVSAQGAPADLLIRSNQDRTLVDGTHLRENLGQTPPVGRVTVAIPARPGRTARQATLTLRCTTIRLKPPYRPDGRLDPLTITVVQACEMDPPSDQEAIDWVLLTNRSATTAADVEMLLSWYLCRWQIEIFFRILKSGCAIESLQLADYKRLQTAIALYLIVAWRILFLIMTSRMSPDLPCSALFADDEWRAAYLVVKRQPPPISPPTLRSMLHLIASLGGFLGRSGDGEPGPKTIWTGLSRVRDFAIALAASAAIADPESSPPKRRKGKRTCG